VFESLRPDQKPQEIQSRGGDWIFFLPGRRSSMWGLLGGGLFSSCLPPQYRQRRPSRIRRRYLVGLIDQLAQFGRRVVAGDAAVLVAQQGPSVFLGYTGCPESSTECVLQVVNGD